MYRQRLLAVSAALLLLQVACGTDATTPPQTGLAALPAPAVFGIDAADSAVLPGKSSSDPTDKHADNQEGIADVDSLGSLGIAALWSGKTYYRGGKYNDNDWPVTIGTLTGVAGGHPAFTISPPKHAATKWVASKHGLFWEFTEAVDTVVYEVIDGTPTVAATLAAADIKVGGWTRLGSLVANAKADTPPRTYAIVPKSVKLSAYKTLSPDVDGAKLGSNPFGSHIRLRVSTEAVDIPFDTATGFTAGPGAHANRYGQNRRFWPVFSGSEANAEAGAVWQAPASGEIYVTWFGSDWASPVTAKLDRPKDTTLAGATSDGAGKLYYLTVAQGSTKPLSTRSVTLHRAHSDRAGTKDEASEAIDATKKGLNITLFGSPSAATNQVGIRYSTGADGKGKVGVIFARKMHKASDGLNHQGAIGVVFDASTLKVLKNLGQTSGHSFSNFVTVDSGGKFLGVDLGDNYPRGVNLHRFDEKGRKSRVVYTFKTLHGTKAQSPAGKSYPKYQDIGGGKSNYKWSNDNSTYTELGGVVETSAGYVIVFASERDSLDNSKATSRHNSPRDIASVLVRKDFEEATKGKSSNWITDDLMLSKSDYTMEGGYFSFGGKWLVQRNTGVLWHTTYADKTDNASRIKTVGLPDGRVAVLWERWDAKSYEETFGMLLNANGTAAGKPFSLGTKLRLGRRDDIFIHDDKLVVVSGNAAGKLVLVDVFTLD